jgi:GAF domain-containing protein
MLGDRVQGVLDVQHDVTDGLEQSDVQLLQSIANQVAIALQNAELYEGAQRTADREATVNIINQRIQQAVTVEGVLQVAARELGKALNANRTSVQVGMATTRTDKQLSSQEGERITPEATPGQQEAGKNNNSPARNGRPLI